MTADDIQRLPSPARVEAGRRNRLKRGDLTADGRRRLSEAALRHQPWRHTLGPVTARGKATVTRNLPKRPPGRKAAAAEVQALLVAAGLLPPAGSSLTGGPAAAAGAVP